MCSLRRSTCRVSFVFVGFVRISAAWRVMNGAPHHSFVNQSETETQRVEVKRFTGFESSPTFSEGWHCSMCALTLYCDCVRSAGAVLFLLCSAQHIVAQQHAPIVAPCTSPATVSPHRRRQLPSFSTLKPAAACLGASDAPPWLRCRSEAPGGRHITAPAACGVVGGGGDEALLPRQSAALPHRFLWLFRELRSSALPFFVVVARRYTFRECDMCEVA